MYGPSLRFKKSLYRLWSQIFWVGWRCHTISAYLYTWFLLCSGWLFCKALRRYVSRISIKSWWHVFSIQHVWIYYLICSISLRSYLYRTKNVFQKDQLFVWHRVLGLKIRSNDLSVIALPHFNYLISNFKILISFENYHWWFYLSWLFKIWINPGCVHNPFWGLGYYLYTYCSGNCFSGPRGIKNNWVNLSRNVCDDYKDICNFRLYGIWLVITADILC